MTITVKSALILFQAKKQETKPRMGHPRCHAWQFAFGTVPSAELTRYVPEL
jgi:hypothetical protein